MGRACSTHRRDDKSVHNLVGRPDNVELLEDLGVDGRILRLLGKSGLGY
jgi:hypothetical protein